jgi:acetyl-CoA carboxylase biotin carboxyl carrier protein
MDVIEKIRQLVSLMSELNLAEIEVEEPELRVKIKASQAEHYTPPAIPEALQQLGAAKETPALREAPAPAAEAPPATKEKLLEITSPMVGTFYRAPNEGAEPYVTVGTVIEPDTVVCIVEAMKVMNEVKAETSGEVVEILVQNAEPVEFGQVLFLARPIEER